MGYQAAESSVLSGLTPTDLTSLFSESRTITVPSGTRLFSPDDDGETLLWLLEGKVDLFRLSRDGKRLVTRQIKPGSVFGVMRMVGHPDWGNFAEAIEESTIRAATKEEVSRLLATRPGLALRLLEVLGNRLSEVEQRLVAIAFSPITVRLADYLLTSANTSDSTVDGISHAEIADTIGACRQSVTSTLSLWKRGGVVQTQRRRIQIVNRRALEKIVLGAKS
ncbi:MAG: Crp/Fnr family transcriptional regulator [Chloroflexi bacterium]|nr:Crp/Fnr family transcriptional regulator [Chloroflexota bacterium]